MHLIKFENLIKNSEGTLRRLCQHVGYEPQDAGLYFGLDESLGRLKDARDAYQKVIALAPNSYWAIRSQARLNSH